jgi:hypothetical protein
LRAKNRYVFTGGGAVIDIKPALKHFIDRGTHPVMLFTVMPCASFEQYVAEGRTPAEIYELAYGKNVVTCRPKADRRQVARTTAV